MKLSELTITVSKQIYAEQFLFYEDTYKDEHPINVIREQW